LQIEGLIPRSPSPVPLEERDLNDLSPEEMLDLLRRKRTQESQKEVKVKKEKRRRAAEDDDDDEDGEVTITEERSLKRPRHLTDSGVEIVDLTDD
jgi:transcription antitermination factor NusG